jgi:hypothetical protein
MKFGTTVTATQVDHRLCDAWLEIITQIESDATHKVVIATEPGLIIWQMNLMNFARSSQQFRPSMVNCM